ncbi:hypothetical protein CORC01_12392 [Colletotrichum orchidophilum]|uniref:Uncharacterized protein n=1 Tax=Colletotrichum orchidophilum TaxID=1209926 RepID=A0A1G4AT34_9PEZI|nr:uncharacterized protein CORC01_12392 [Colletotrichum orchidophilum]OHE92330.1 hypothetical protein CORC01_12392 [Colletotrichum orchidophilum]
MAGGVDLEEKENGFDLPRIKPGPGSLAAGSPYIGLVDKFNLALDIKPATIERYLQDVVVSTISLNQMPSGPLWVNADPVEALIGTNVYRFSEPWQFYAPMGGSENLSRELKDVKLRFGMKEIMSGAEVGDGGVLVAVLGAESEIERFRS